MCEDGCESEGDEEEEVEEKKEKEKGYWACMLQCPLEHAEDEVEGEEKRRRRRGSSIMWRIDGCCLLLVTAACSSRSFSRSFLSSLVLFSLLSPFQCPKANLVLFNPKAHQTRQGFHALVEWEEREKQEDCFLSSFTFWQSSRDYKILYKSTRLHCCSCCQDWFWATAGQRTHLFTWLVFDHTVQHYIHCKRKANAHTQSTVHGAGSHEWASELTFLQNSALVNCH